MGFARQPILDATDRLAGYELLAEERPAPAGALAALGAVDLREAGAGAVVHLDVTGAALLDLDPLPLPPDGLVLEIPADESFDGPLGGRIRALAADGYRLALDGLAPGSAAFALLDVMALAKVDVGAVGEGHATALARILARHEVTPVATAVDTREARDRLAGSGFELFQGDFVCTPRALAAPPAPASLAALRAAAMVSVAGDAEALIEAIGHDPVLSLRLLRFVNSAELSLRHRVSSVPHAVRLLGPRTVRQWATLVLVCGGETAPGPLLVTALARSRTCEAIAQRLEMESPDAYALTGLLSVADALLDAPMDAVLADLPLADDITAALLDRSGGKGRALRMAEGCERGAWHEAAIPNLDGGALCALHAEALRWADATALGLSPELVSAAA